MKILISLVLCFVITQHILSQNNLTTSDASIHTKIFKLDSHTDTPLRLLQKNFDFTIDNSQLNNHSKVDIPRMKTGDINSMVFAAFVGQGERTIEYYDSARIRIEKILQVIDSTINRNESILINVTNSKEIKNAFSDKKISILKGIENGYCIGKNLKLIDTFYKKGVRYITLCHTKNNDICDSSTDPNGIEHNGLSTFGKQVIKKMNEIGMMIDLSHVSDKAAIDVLKISKTPVIFSHSCVKGIYDNPRNVSDLVLKELKKNSGVIQMCLYSGYIKAPEKNQTRDSLIQILNLKYNNNQNLPDSTRQKYRAELYEINESFPVKLVTVKDLVDHIDYVVKLIGIDFVGIGSDFDGGGGLIDCMDVGQINSITTELVNRGYSSKDIKKIWGKNFLRVLKKVEDYAH